MMENIGFGMVWALRNICMIGGRDGCFCTSMYILREVRAYGMGWMGLSIECTQTST